MGVSPILIPIFSVIGFFATVIWVAYVVLEAIRSRHRVRLTSELQLKMLERITSVSELGAFLNTEAGTQFLKGLQLEGGGPRDRVLGALQSGAVLGALGIGLFLYGWMTPTVPSGVTNGVNFVATIFFAMGIGFVVSAAVSYRLAKNRGIAADDGSRHDRGFPTV